MGLGCGFTAFVRLAVVDVRGGNYIGQRQGKRVVYSETVKSSKSMAGIYSMISVGSTERLLARDPTSWDMS